jgi:3-phenylpropionate/trans-cinnamate dioxygenase ferredoxin subunit
MSRHAVCRIEELPPGSSKVFVLDRESIGVFNVEGTLYAVRNTCPHQGAPLCHGTVGGTFLPSNPHEYVYGLEGRVLRCPWHAWEFDLRTGRAIFAPDRVRIKVYPVTVEDRIVVVEV